MSQSPVQSLLDSIGGSTKGTLAAVGEAYRDDFKESVQTVVWIVGLATGTMVLLVSSSNALGLRRLAVQWTVGLLLATILAGILQRITQRVASLALRTVMILAEIASAAADTAIGIPLPRSEWTPEQTMVAAKRVFGDAEQDTFLELSQQQDSQMAQALYEMLRIGKRIEYVGSIIEAIDGDHPVRAVTPSERSILEDIALKGKAYNCWLNAANVFYFAACGLFAATLAVMGISFIR